MDKDVLNVSLAFHLLQTHTKKELLSGNLHSIIISHIYDDKICDVYGNELCYENYKCSHSNLSKVRNCIERSWD